MRAAFDATAHDYDRTRRRLVPCFDAFYGAALDALTFGADDAPHVVDLGAGTGLLPALIAGVHPGARFTLVDVSDEMLARARERLGDASSRHRFVHADVADASLPEDCDAVVSALAIHHLDGPDKRALYGRVFDALRPGGVFVNADQMLGATPEQDREQWQAWEREARALGASDEELGMARERMREDRPSTLEDQLAWLREAGFRGVRCSFRSGPFAVLAARR